MTDKKNYNLYKGSDFVIEEYFKEDEIVFAPTSVNFKAVDFETGDVVFDFSLSTSPAYITIATDNLVKIKIPAAETQSLENSRLIYELDTVNSAGDDVRQFIGVILVL